MIDNEHNAYLYIIRFVARDFKVCLFPYRGNDRCSRDGDYDSEGKLFCSLKETVVVCEKCQEIRLIKTSNVVEEKDGGFTIKPYEGGNPDRHIALVNVEFIRGLRNMIQTNFQVL